MNNSMTNPNLSHLTTPDVRKMSKPREFKETKTKPETTKKKQIQKLKSNNIHIIEFHEPELTLGII
jgi:hypothetical protein